MKMKNIEIINHINNLEEFIKKEIQVPYKVRRAIVKNRQALISEYNIYNEERVKLLESLGKKNESEMTDEELEAYREKKEEVNTKIRDMLNEEVDVDILKISENDLEIDGLTVKDEIALEFMVEVEEKKEEKQHGKRN